MSIFDAVVWPPAPPEPSDPLAGFRAEFRDALLALVDALDRPVVVQPSDVRVGAPQVTVEAPDMDPFTEQIVGLRADIEKLIAMLARPVEREVERDDDGLIVRMVERRG